MKTNTNTVHNYWSRIWLPYCIVKRKHARFKHVWLPLNRDYKPIGFDQYRMPTDQMHVNYDDYLEQAWFLRRCPIDILNLKLNEKPAKGERLVMSDMIWFYNDGDKAQENYFEEMQTLLCNLRKPPLSSTSAPFGFSEIRRHRA